ncbi:DUF1997 domain-containing protein [Lyngbya sp. CCY1209]|jgi:hypothetical protein|uniref:DUF1997 domain-containing protein n=1 Tax=Lyngbya sp. CCY1209 TaxID=2886103 RepID=UPI002D217260|nr:DUF1997 domain-containing protein [Lyngbya sp. CCY1209]MEB3884274.1 DUF1997 domain-containing protein [Lyngbya sp. CCY1209]
MQHDLVKLQPVAASDPYLREPFDLQSSDSQNREASGDRAETIWFHTQYEDCMEMFADLDTVAEYLGTHRGWFCRCAQPMKTEPIGENAYALIVGRFGAFGYQVEARVGLELVPPDETGTYRIRTTPIPDYVPPGYEVDFQSIMKLVELPLEQVCEKYGLDPKDCPATVVGAKWHLDLAVGVKFPQFILSMSRSLIQKTGDGLLKRIVNQVSRRLSYKTQMDFHTTHNLPFPLKGKKR